jgi:hypothetical protein
MADPLVPPVDMLEGIQEDLAVIVSLEDGLLLISTRRDVMDSTDIFDAQRARQGRRTTKEGRHVKPQDLTLRFPVTGEGPGHDLCERLQQERCTLT